MSVCIHLTGNSTPQVLDLEPADIDLDILQIRAFPWKKNPWIQECFKKWLRVYTNGNVNYSAPEERGKPAISHGFLLKTGQKPSCNFIFKFLPVLARAAFSWKKNLC